MRPLIWCKVWQKCGEKKTALRLAFLILILWVLFSSDYHLPAEGAFAMSSLALINQAIYPLCTELLTELSTRCRRGKMLRISLLLLLEQKISTGGLLLALGGGVQTFPQKRGGEERRRMAVRC